MRRDPGTATAASAARREDDVLLLRPALLLLLEAGRGRAGLRGGRGGGRGGHRAGTGGEAAAAAQDVAVDVRVLDADAVDHVEEVLGVHSQDVGGREHAPEMESKSGVKNVSCRFYLPEFTKSTE